MVNPEDLHAVAAGEKEATKEIKEVLDEVSNGKEDGENGRQSVG